MHLLGNARLSIWKTLGVSKKLQFGWIHSHFLWQIPFHKADNTSTCLARFRSGSSWTACTSDAPSLPTAGWYRPRPHSCNGVAFSSRDTLCTRPRSGYLEHDLKVYCVLYHPDFSDTFEVLREVVFTASWIGERIAFVNMANATARRVDHLTSAEPNLEA